MILFSHLPLCRSRRDKPGKTDSPETLRRVPVRPSASRPPFNQPIRDPKPVDPHHSRTISPGMAYAQWIIVAIYNGLADGFITIKNVNIKQGKFFGENGMDYELSAEQISQKTIVTNDIEYVRACGRAHSPSGTEGSLELYELDTKICKLYWSCPWGSKTNDFRVQDHDPTTSRYWIKCGPYSRESGAIGTVTLAVSPYFSVNSNESRS
ncbi:hypothetical protein XA68_13432 [Ophiocordyceps unilateralis]|uniref:Uncharacterized protein n=1 Tax=Ophiocordyceps unilateralis TaxID=268505 RepID=A0A2A9PB50_OPHUN|nr:hypothetical protein XA68_13432 [Ophiocordyceps unilateralis]